MVFYFITFKDYSGVANISNDWANISNEDYLFNSWLSGLIDGDGYLGLSRKSTNLKITLATKDLAALQIIQAKLRWGYVNKLADVNAFAFTTHS